MFSACFDKLYFDRLYPSRFDGLKEEDTEKSENTCSDRFTPSLTSEQKMRFQDNIEKKEDEFFYKERSSDRLYKTLFNKPRPIAGDNLFSFQHCHRSGLNTIQESVVREEMAREHQRFLEEPKTVVSITSSQTLNAPNLEKDFYMNLLDVSAKNSVIFALKDDLHIKSRFVSKDKIKPISFKDNPITCVHSIGKSETVFGGFINGKVFYVDGETGRKVIPGKSVPSCVYSATSGVSPSLLYGGTKGRSILKIDLRSPYNPDFLINAEMEGVIDQICGLTLSPDESKLALGTNDNKVEIRDLRKANLPCITFDTEAAVKALTWSPWERDILFAGGGTSDRSIYKFSTASEGEVIFRSDTDAQVTGIHATNQRERIVSCHGYSKCVAMVWDSKRHEIIPKMELKGHKGRILNSALNSEKTKLLTLAGDEQLKIWNLNDDSFKSKEKVKGKSFLFDNPHSLIR